MAVVVAAAAAVFPEEHQEEMKQDSHLSHFQSHPLITCIPTPTEYAMIE